MENDHLDNHGHYNDHNHNQDNDHLDNRSHCNNPDYQARTLAVVHLFNDPIALLFFNAAVTIVNIVTIVTIVTIGNANLSSLS